MRCFSVRAICSFLFYLLLYGWTLLYLFLIPVLTFCPDRYVEHASRLWCRVNLWFMWWALGLRYRTFGTLPRSSCLVACRHESAWETIALPFILPRSVFILKESLFRIPVYGWFLKKLHMIGIQRNHSTAKTLKTLTQRVKERAKEGHMIVIFPEGTRVSPGESKAYKSGIWYLYIHTDLPVVPVGLNSGAFWPRRSWIKTSGEVTLTFGSPIEPGISDKATFMRVLRQRIECPPNH
jgi:1-acyl-sn-glycerol-3-phosphate acyltransferase